MRFLKQLTIKHKLLVILILSALSVCVMFVTFLYTNQTSQNKLNISEHFDDASDFVNKLQIEILTARAHEKDFLIHKSKPYLTEYREIIKTINKDFLELKELTIDDKDFHLLISEVHTLLTTYNTKFEKVAQISIKNGLDHNTGLLGELRQAVHNVERALSKHNRDKLTKSMLLMRRHEKDFIARQDIVYLQKLNKEYTIFITQLDNANLSGNITINIHSLINSYHKKVHKMANGINEIELTITEYKDAIRAIDPMLSNLLIATNNLKVSATKEFQKTTLNTQYFYYLVLTLLSLSVLPIIYFLIRSINTSTEKITRAVKDIANGEADLTHRVVIESKDEMHEIADWFNKIIDNIQSTLEEVKISSDRLINASLTSQSAKDLTTTAIQTQVTEVSNIADSIKNMSDSIEVVTNNAKTASDKANNAVDVANVGYDAFSEVITSIEQLADDVNEANQSIQLINTYTTNIGSIVTMINEIADQTNLLSLNAAIEAARAGDEGRGFAVVAEEVRALAQRTTESTEEIQNTIHQLQTGTDKSVQVIEQGQSQATQSVEKARIANQSFKDIALSISSIAELNSNIATSTLEHSHSAHQINNNIEAINLATNELLESANQSMSDSGDLSQTASMLQAISSRYTNSEVEESSVEDLSTVELF